MSNTKQILAMLESHAEKDEERFFAIALQVAAAEARKGHRDSANALRDAVEEARKTSPARQRVPVSFATPRGDLADILILRKPRYKLTDVALSNSLSDQLDILVNEQIKREWLREHGKTPNRRVLFIGPPGSGKTMSAEALASTLNLPLYVIRLETLITRFMGDTAAKLSLVFDEVSKRRAVFLFDEFDALVLIIATNWLKSWVHEIVEPFTLQPDFRSISLQEERQFPNQAFFPFSVHAVLLGQDPIGASLEDMHLACLLGNLRNKLDATGCITDDSNSLTF